LGRIHALWTLEGLFVSVPEQFGTTFLASTNLLRLLNADTNFVLETRTVPKSVLEACFKTIKDTNPKIQVAGIRVAESLTAGDPANQRALLQQLAQLANGTSEEALFQAALSAGNLPKPEALPLLRNIGKNGSKLHTLAGEITKIEEQSDQLNDEGLRALYKGRARKDPLTFIIGSELYEHYGVSEYQLVIGHGVRHPVKPGSVGKLLPGVEVAILDDDFKPVPNGELGQFAISTKDPGLFLGYYKDQQRTNAVIRNGWYFTGDLAYQDGEGYFYIAGRRDDCFKSRGIFISPTEIENALQKHPAVIEAAVVPEPDAEIGNKIRAVLVLNHGQSPSDSLAQAVHESLRHQIAPFKLPHRIEFAESLPKSAVGKILRTALIVRSSK
jgi:acyl-CoA synthetase (AMP-forming)/AMP-acid ligase II